MLYKSSLAVTFLVCILVIIAAQFATPTLYDADSYLHIRMAEFIREHGLRYDFHWARYSVFAERFSDKDLLYHIAIIPFTFLANIFLGAKWAAVFFALLLFLVFYWVIRRYSLAWLVPLFSLFLAMSAPFLQALSRTRPMVLMILLSLLFTHLQIYKKLWGLFLVSMVYTLTHVSSPLLLVFALLAECVRFANERQFYWQSVATVAAAMLAGFVVHPNFPNNLLVFYINGILVPIFAFKWGLELGAEFFPCSMREFVLGYPLILMGLLLIIALGSSKDNKIKTSTKIWMSTAGFYFVLSFFSKRYIIHSYPLILIATAAFITDWWQSGQRLGLIRKNILLRTSIIAAFILLFARIGFSTQQQFKELALNEKIYNSSYEAFGAWMKDNLPAGEVVFHANWSDSQFFIGLNPKDDYFVTLDPMYMYYWNPKKYQLYRDIAFGRSNDLYRDLKEEFNVRYGFASKDYFNDLINQVRNDSRFAVLAENGLGIVFMLR